MAVDELGLGDAIARIPAHLAGRRAGADVAKLALTTAPREVLVLGRSVAAHATEFVNAAFGPVLRAPVSFVPSSRLPDRVGEGTVVVAVALSSADEAVFEQANVALARKASVVVFASGSAATDTTAAGAHWRALPAVPRERIGLYGVVAGVIDVLEAAQVLAGGAAALREAATRARARIEGPFADRSFGEELARRLGRTFPFLVGAPAVGLAAARWWQVAMAANARLLAHAEGTAEYRDALLAGFGQSGDVTRQVATLVLLRSASDPPESMAVFAAIEEWLAEAVAGILVVEAEGASPLAQLVDLAVLGDLTSVALARSEGIDPGPAPLIDAQE